MARTCMRPGCDRPASARVAFDPVALQLWLDPLSLHAAPVQELCEFHVERLTVPRGWTATDRRPGAVVPVAPVVVVAEPPAEPAAAEPEAARPAAVEVAIEEIAIEEPVAEEPVEDEPVDAEPGAAVAGGTPSRRRSVRREEQSLLSRAFALSGPQESVLTDGRTNVSAPVESSD